MASEFDKKLNERFDDASLGELMPEFNTDNEWNRIEQKLDKKKMTLSLLWLSHAAVLAVGLLISWVFMKQWMGNESHMQTPPAIVHQHTDTPAKAVQAMEPAIKEETLVAGKIKAVPIRKEKKTMPAPITEKAPEAIQEEEPLAVQEQERTVEPKAEPVIAARPGPGVQAVHMLDINNEDKQIMIEGNDPKLQYKDPIARLLSPGRQPDNTNGNPDRPLLIRGFFEK